MGSTDFEFERKVEVRSNLHGGKGIVAERRSPELASGLDFCKSEESDSEFSFGREKAEEKKREKRCNVV
ncbi:hypothetical protein DEO72_LG2g794 [Vigna unguiculata]|uniref:Uncharacterized protein n=1 Tax=Vigna unguiculata TaxID=3917 RepID=A0A4D6KV11_VIGUN|nr:hypothetical protein DEO72_LG2g794 [Vigna unguiculata]